MVENEIILVNWPYNSVMYSSTGGIAEILSYSYITLMCTVFIYLIFFLLYMSRDYHIYYIFILYVVLCNVKQNDRMT